MLPRFCRIAILVDDMESFVAETGRLLGLRYIRPGLIDQLYPGGGFDVRFFEHGLEPISGGAAFAKEGRLIEVAIDVADAEAARESLEGAGHAIVTTSYLPVPDATEYLFGRSLHGVPFLVCTAGDNEAQMRSEVAFAELGDAKPPKIGAVTLLVDDAAGLAAELERLIGMRFVEVDPAGLGARTLGGAHRVRLVERASALLDGIEPPLASIDFLVNDVEAARARFEAAGYAVRHSRPLAEGGNAYYLGPTMQGMPVTLYPAETEAELLGLSAPLAPT